MLVTKREGGEREGGGGEGERGGERGEGEGGYSKGVKLSDNVLLSIYYTILHVIAI